MSHVIRLEFGSASRSVNWFNELERLCLASFLETAIEKNLFSDVNEVHESFGSVISFYSNMKGLSEPVVRLIKRDLSEGGQDTGKDFEYSLEMVLFKKNSHISERINHKFKSFDPVCRMIKTAIDLRLGMEAGQKVVPMSEARGKIIDNTTGPENPLHPSF